MQFVAEEGQLTAHLFENPRMGIERCLYWSVNVELKPIKFLGETWDCSFGCEWLNWPAKSLEQLSGMSLDQHRQPGQFQASIYLVSQHCPVAMQHLSIQTVSGDRFRLKAKGKLQAAIDGKKVRSSFSFDLDLSFQGIAIVRENLFPKPSNAAEAASALAPFFSLEDLTDPQLEGFSYIFRAKHS